VLAELKRRMIVIQTHIDWILKSAFGDALPTVKLDRARAFRYLQSDNWKQRFGALVLLERHWRLSNEILLPLCYRMIGNDPEDQIIALAISVCGRTMAGTASAECSRRIAEKGLLKMNCWVVQRSAILALIEINGTERVHSSDEAVRGIKEKLRLLRGDLQDIQPRDLFFKYL
jgi:hypothetical protein